GQRAKGTAFCHGGYIRQADLDASIVDLLLKHYGDEAGLERYLAEPAAEREARADAVARAAAEARRELAALERELSVIGRDYRREQITAAEYHEQKVAVGREQARLTAQLDELARTLAECRAPVAAASLAEVAAAQRWTALTPAERKQVLRQLIAHLAVFRRPDANEIQCDLTWAGR
ncbi:MAG TPA: hypothetical protein VNT75_26740, partial [Symbiobacteriaceae bacterium]|nr:hypothetical protein [Symbiobacteriaceae bacterium]